MFPVLSAACWLRFPWFLTYFAVMCFYPNPDVLRCKRTLAGNDAGNRKPVVIAIFGIVMGWTLIETSTGIIHAALERVNNGLKEAHKPPMTRQTAGNPDYHRSGWLYGSVQGWHHRPDRNGLQRIVLRFPCNLCTASDYSRRIQNLQAAQGRKRKNRRSMQFPQHRSMQSDTPKEFLTQVRIYIHIYIQTKYIKERRYLRVSLFF